MCCGVHVAVCVLQYACAVCVMQCVCCSVHVAVCMWQCVHRVDVELTERVVHDVLQWCCSGVAVVLQWCCSGVAVVLQWYCIGVAGLQCASCSVCVAVRTNSFTRCGVCRRCVAVVLQCIAVELQCCSVRVAMRTCSFARCGVCKKCVAVVLQCVAMVLQCCSVAKYVLQTVAKGAARVYLCVCHAAYLLLRAWAQIGSEHCVCTYQRMY